jgi:hypothetical protein
MANWRSWCLTLSVAIALVCSSLGQATPGSAASASATYAGITFGQLSSQDLDTIQANTGYRLGVYVISVQKSSPAYGILTPGSVVLTIGKQGVDTPASAVAALRKVKGPVSVVALINTGGQFVAKTVELVLGSPGATTPRAPAHHTPPAAGTTLNLSSPDDLITAYYDLLDFLRSQAWSRTYATPKAERQRVMRILEQAWPAMDQQARSGISAIATAWLALKKAWPDLTPAKRSQLRGTWRTFLLLPTMIFPPLDHPQMYSNSSGSFEYPSGWSGGQTAANGTGYLFLGPGGAGASWNQVLNTATSPAGALIIQAPLTADLQGMTSLDAAHLYERQFLAGASGFKEILATSTDQAAMVAVHGTFPGQSQEKFYWIVALPQGDHYVVCRMGGPVAQSESLVPDFWNMLTSVQYQEQHSSSSGESNETYAAWDTAWSKVGTAVVANIWASSDN